MEARAAPRDLQEGPRLYRALCHDFKQVQLFFRFDPYEDDAYRQRAGELDAQPCPESRRRDVAGALLEHNRRLGAARPALEGLERLGRGEALAVVAAQTPVLLTGPLFTLWKAVTLVELANRLEKLLDRPVVPLFWVASDDHDFHQLRHIHILDRDAGLQRLALDLSPPPRLTAGNLRIPPQEAAALWGRLERLVDGGPHLDELRRIVRWHELNGELTAATWFSRIMVGLMSQYGLAVVDPRLPALRYYAKSLMQQALVRRELMTRELRAANLRLRKHDFGVVYKAEPGHTFMFHHRDGERYALFWRDGMIRDRMGNLALKPAELARRLHRDPDDFSPNAVLRAVLQDYLLPTVAAVAGPEEVVFYAQIREVYPLFSLTCPVVHPRVSVTLIENRDHSAMQRYGLNIPRVLKGLEPFQDVELNRLASVDVDRRFAHEKDELRRRYDSLAEDLSRISPDLAEITQRNLAHVLAQLEYLERKARQHHRRRHRELINTFTALERRLHPKDQLQEQVLNAMPFLIRHGPRLLESVMEEVPLTPQHHFLYLDPVQQPRKRAAGAAQGE